MPPAAPPPRARWRQHIGNIIFGLELQAARNYDKALIVLIILSVIAVMLESVSHFSNETHTLLRNAEWVFTILFTLDYLGRIVGARRPAKYIFSFYGIIDLITILPSYLSLFFPGSQYLLMIRALRLLRIFRVFKLMRYSDQGGLILKALSDSREKIIVFFVSVLTLVTVFGTVVYLIEGPKNGFTSIPTSIYWAVVTVTTVGYGDISPKTALGKLIATLAMLMGYAIIAVPTGIVTAGLQEAKANAKTNLSCSRCGLTKHEKDARFCKRCGERLAEKAEQES